MDLYSDTVEEVVKKNDQDVFLLMFLALPHEDNEDFYEVGGAYISCWVNTPTLREAEILALEMIAKEKWKPIKFENWDFVNEASYTEKTDLTKEEAEEYLSWLRQALEEGITVSIHCWPVDAEEEGEGEEGTDSQ
jgi:hypothetical protein